MTLGAVAHSKRVHKGNFLRPHISAGSVSEGTSIQRKGDEAMKTFITIIAVLIGSNSMADETAWLHMQLLASGADDEEHIKAHGFSEEGIPAFRERITTARAEIAELGAALYKDLCDNGALYKTDPEQLAQKFESYEAEYASTRDTAVENLKASLSQADQAAWHHFTEHAVVKEFGVDLPTELRTGNLTAEALVARACTLSGEVK